ncbi:MAG: hypothetical protein WAX04_06295, partial [Oscillospiraceae bacterium]
YSVMSTGVEKVAAKAREDKNFVFTSLAHHIGSQRLWESLKKVPTWGSTYIPHKCSLSIKKHTNQGFLVYLLPESLNIWYFLSVYMVSADPLKNV